MRAPIVFSLLGAAGIGLWLVLRKRTPDGVVSISEISSGDIAGSISFTQPEISVSAPKLADIEESSPLEFIAVTARKIAATVSSWTRPAGEKYRPLFNAAEKKYGIPPGLLFRQAYQESRFREDIISGKVRSSAGATGIMQIIPRLHPEVGEAGALDPARAIPYAGKILAAWKKQFGSWELALAAYNAGPGNVSKYKGIPPFKETRDYVSQITSDINVRVA